jgi:hypothetical protein
MKYERWNRETIYLSYFIFHISYLPDRAALFFSCAGSWLTIHTLLYRRRCNRATCIFPETPAFPKNSYSNTIMKRTTGFVAFLVLTFALTAFKANAQSKASVVGDGIANNASAISPFEGTITMTTTGIGDDEKHDVLMNLKGAQMQFDIDAGVQGHIQLYPDVEKQKIYIVLASQHMGMEQPLTHQSATVELKPLGKKDTIAGHPAEAYLLSTPEADITLWETNDLPANVRQAYDAALPHILQEDKNMIAALDQFGKKNMAPVQIDVNVKQMDQKITIELVKVEPKKLDDAIFALPKDITFQPMPQQQGQQQGSNPGADTHN